jgi:hypothetical protein
MSAGIPRKRARERTASCAGYSAVASERLDWRLGPARYPIYGGSSAAWRGGGRTPLRPSVAVAEMVVRTISRASCAGHGGGQRCFLFAFFTAWRHAVVSASSSSALLSADSVAVVQPWRPQPPGTGMKASG